MIGGLFRGSLATSIKMPMGIVEAYLLKFQIIFILLLSAGGEVFFPAGCGK